MENAIARKLDPPEINPIEIESVLLNRLASVGQKSYAEHMGISESTVSRRKAEGYFCNMAKELAFLGIQAAPPEAVLVSRNYLTAVEILADAGLKAERAGAGCAGVGLKMTATKGESRGEGSPTAFWCKNGR